MSIIYHKFCSVFLCGLGNPHRQPFEGLIHHFTHGGSIAQQAAHHGLVMHTAAVTAAAAKSASSAAVAAAAGSAAMTAAVKQGHAWGVKAVWTTLLVATTAWFNLMTSSYDNITLVITALPRTLRTTLWVMRAGSAYKRFAAAHVGEDPESDAYQEALGQLHTHWAQSLLELCRLNGGVYIKAGQFASAFVAVPREFRLALANLEDRAQPRPFEVIQVALLKELGPGALQFFSKFDENAIAAASLAQVHKARLVTGEDVAVKVQYPGLERSVGSDLAVLRTFNSLATRLFPSYQLAWLVDELENKLSLELDFRTEIMNAERVGELLHKSKRAAVPRMHHQLCTPRLLVMEWVEGSKVNDVDTLHAKSISPKAVGRQLIKLFGELFLVHGFMHGDPHAGNIMVRTTGKPRWWHWLFRGSRTPFQLVLLDHGTYLDLNTELREQLCQLWCSFVMQDEELKSDLCFAVGGERGPKVLPVLLTQTARSRSEEAAVRKAAGIAGVGDMAALLQSAPREVVEVLRINTVIRSICGQLGLPMPERQRVLAGYARRGLPALGSTRRHVHAKFNQLLVRTQLRIKLGVVGVATAVSSFAVRGWSLVLSTWSDVLFDA